MLPTSEYDESTPRHTLAGDPHDDDAQVIDSLVQPQAEPPPAQQLPQERIVPAKVEPAPMTRLITGSIVIQASWDAPQLILPADPKRTSLQVWAASGTATDYARLADDAGKVQTRSACALLYSGQLLTFPLTCPGGHTGPVWVSAPDAVGPVTVSFIAVTA